MIKMWKLCGALILIVTSGALTQSDESCSGIRSLRQDGCAQAIVLRIPSDGSGTYNLILNASLPIYSNENMHVTLENENSLKMGTASHLIYAVTHPACETTPRITHLRFNDHLLCRNEPHHANTRHAATQLYHASTHFGAKSFQTNLAAQLNDFSKKFVENNFLQSTSTQPALDTPFAHNPFLSSLSSSSASNPSANFFYNPLLHNRGSGDGNKVVYNANPFLNESTARPSSQAPAPAPAPEANGDTCGSATVALVQNGIDVKPGEFPWLGGLFRAIDVVLGAEYLCTVNLVSHQYIITAAHCFASSDPKEYFVLLGHQRGKRKNVTWVREIHIHPAYRSENITHDVAVMRVREDVVFNAAIRPICLWSATRREASTGTIAGFGPDYRSFRKIQFPIVSKERCLSSHAHFHQVLSEFMFCAGTRNNDGPCVGDSGAGFMQWIADRYYLRGLVSHSLSANGTCDLEQFILFSDLSTEMNWIRTIVQ